MMIRITVGATTIEGALLDNATARDFLSLLPLTLPLEDYASTEKIAYLPRKLSLEGAPQGSTPSAGDLAYYAPWGNVAIFYKDAPYAKGLIKIGRFNSGVETLGARRSPRATFELRGK